MAKQDVKPKAVISDTAVWCRYDAAVDVEQVIPNPRNPNSANQRLTQKHKYVILLL